MKLPIILGAQYNTTRRLKITFENFATTSREIFFNRLIYYLFIFFNSIIKVDIGMKIFCKKKK